MFTCNITGDEFDLEEDEKKREGGLRFGYNIRQRAICYCLTKQLYGESNILEDLDTNTSIKGIGLMDGDWANMLDYKFDFVSTYSHKKPLLNINDTEDVEKYKDYVDQFFVTTDKNNIHSSIPKNKLNFMPVPCSYVCENLNLYQTRNHEFDIFYAVSHGVNRGVLKKNKTDERYNFLKLLMSRSHELTYNIFGFNNIQPVWGDQFIKEISKCKFALNLSRGQPVKYYSSNRIASLVANGIPTLIDKKVKFNDFFSNKEMIFYEDTYDLIDKVNFYKKNERQRIQIGINGKNKYFKIFNNRIIADYIFSKTLGNKPSYKYIWDK